MADEELVGLFPHEEFDLYPSVGRADDRGEQRLVGHEIGTGDRQRPGGLVHQLDELVAVGFGRESRTRRHQLQAR